MLITEEDVRRGYAWQEERKHLFVRDVYYEHGFLVFTLFGSEKPVKVATESIPPLRNRTPEELGDIEVSPMRDMLHFARIDVDVYVPKLFNPNL
ncbi:hypothetical protein QCE49_12815 [Caballeronia sp. LZ008]|uniref:hypothetical protein n=1 Tax=unclassified Caballeronia TaxID=2646786 RepID=UPI0020277757|nr:MULTISPECIES: hypothetical protein [unclassified Caballeronia]MDR5794255.1 hypothetical protein [Caballeronia sp. LZ008]